MVALQPLLAHAIPPLRFALQEAPPQNVLLFQEQHPYAVVMLMMIAKIADRLYIA